MKCFMVTSIMLYSLLLRSYEATTRNKRKTVYNSPSHCVSMPPSTPEETDVTCEATEVCHATVHVIEHNLHLLRIVEKKGCVSHHKIANNTIECDAMKSRDDIAVDCFCSNDFCNQFNGITEDKRAEKAERWSQAVRKVYLNVTIASVWKIKKERTRFSLSTTRSWYLLVPGIIGSLFFLIFGCYCCVRGQLKILANIRAQRSVMLRHMPPSSTDTGPYPIAVPAAATAARPPTNTAKTRRKRQSRKKPTSLMTTHTADDRSPSTTAKGTSTCLTTATDAPTSAVAATTVATARTDHTVEVELPAETQSQLTPTTPSSPIVASTLRDSRRETKSPKTLVASKRSDRTRKSVEHEKATARTTTVDKTIDKPDTRPSQEGAG